MARPRRNTPENVSKAVNQLIQDYESNGVLPTDFRLMELLHVSKGTLDRYYEGRFDKDITEDDTGDIAITESYAEALKRLISFRQQLCTESMTRKTQPTPWIFLSKQPHWGGFQDVQRVERSGNLGVQISLTGPDGKPIKNA